MQQNRAGKDDEEEKPTNGSLKETGSWENDASKVVFLWYDPKIKRKKLIITKNRNGKPGAEFVLDWYGNTQTFRENKEQNNEPEKKESFWKTLSKMLCSLAMFNAINKHY